MIYDTLISQVKLGIVHFNHITNLSTNKHDRLILKGLSAVFEDKIHFYLLIFNDAIYSSYQLKSNPLLKVNNKFTLRALSAFFLPSKM